MNRLSSRCCEFWLRRTFACFWCAKFSSVYYTYLYTCRFTSIWPSTTRFCTFFSQQLSSLLSMWPNQHRRHWRMTIGLMPTQAWSSSQGYLSLMVTSHIHQPLRFFNFDRPSLTTIKHNTTNACCIQLPFNFQQKLPWWLAIEGVLWTFFTHFLLLWQCLIRCHHQHLTYHLGNRICLPLQVGSSKHHFFLIVSICYCTTTTLWACKVGCFGKLAFYTTAFSMDPAYAGGAENGIPTYSLQAHTTGELPSLVLWIT